MSIQAISNLAQTQLTNSVRSLSAEATGNSPENINTSTVAQNKFASAPNSDTAPPGQLANEDELNQVVQEMNDFVKPINNSLEFSVDKDTGTTVVKVLDTETQEVIKQIPSEEMLALAKAIGQLKGLFVKQQV